MLLHKAQKQDFSKKGEGNIIFPLSPRLSCFIKKTDLVRKENFDLRVTNISN